MSKKSKKRTPVWSAPTQFKPIEKVKYEPKTKKTKRRPAAPRVAVPHILTANNMRAMFLPDEDSALKLAAGLHEKNVGHIRMWREVPIRYNVKAKVGR